MADVSRSVEDETLGSERAVRLPCRPIGRHRGEREPDGDRPLAKPSERSGEAPFRARFEDDQEGGGPAGGPATASAQQGVVGRILERSDRRTERAVELYLGPFRLDGRPADRHGTSVRDSAREGGLEPISSVCDGIGEEVGRRSHARRSAEQEQVRRRLADHLETRPPVEPDGDLVIGEDTQVDPFAVGLDGVGGSGQRDQFAETAPARP